MSGRRAIVALATLSLTACSASAEDPSSALAFMSGCWKGSLGDRRIHEHYSTARTDFWLGTLSEGAPGDKPFYELLVFEFQDETWILTPHPRGTKSEVVFRMTEHGKNRAVFENPKHDYPRRIVYEIGSDGHLNTTVAGERNGKPVTVQYFTEQSACRTTS